MQRQFSEAVNGYDNSFIYTQGPATQPDADGNWPLRKDGWGHGRAYFPTTGQTRKAWGWHRYGAWVGIVTALEAGVPKAREAWDTMRRLASEDAIYGYEMIPRDGGKDADPGAANSQPGGRLLAYSPARDRSQAGKAALVTSEEVRRTCKPVCRHRVLVRQTAPGLSFSAQDIIANNAN